MFTRGLHRSHPIQKRFWLLVKDCQKNLEKKYERTHKNDAFVEQKPLFY